MAEDNTPTNVVDDIDKLNQELNTKYADVIDNDYGLNFELRDGRLHITDMYLKDTERGKGIGSQIFDEIKLFADNNNLEISLYNDGDINTTFWENKGFQEWSSKNNVDFANTPDDKLGLFILDTDTPTNVVDDTPKQSNILDNITRELGGVDYVEFYTRKNNDKFPSVGVNVDANGNIIIFRATDDPNRLINSNFKQIGSDSGTSGMGQQSYFSTDFLYSKEYSLRENRKIYGFNTNIKPEEILQLNKTLNDYPDLAKALQPQFIFTKPEYKNTLIHYLISQQMNISPEIWNKNIPIIKSLGYKAIGTPITGQPHNYGVNYEIVPLIDDNKNVEIIPISEINYRGVNPETDKMLNAYDRESYEAVKLDTPTNVVDEVPTNVIDLDNQVVIDTEYGSGRDITVTVDKDGNVVLFRGTDDPNRGINVDFESQVGRGEVGYGKGNYFSPNPQYAANYAQPSRRRLYGYSTGIKPNEILNFRTKISDNIELAKKLGVEDIYWDVSNPNHQSFSYEDLFFEMDKEDVWNEAIGDYEVTKKSKYGRSWFQNNIDIFKDNGVKAFITTEVGESGFTKAEIFPLVTETNNLNIKPVVQYSVDGPGKNLSQFTEIPLDTPNRPFGPGAAYIDEIALSTESFVDNLPLEKGVKDLFLNAADNRLKRIAGQVATPGGILDLIDIWEIGVLALVAGAIAYNEIDEIPKIGKNAIIRTWNLSRGRPIDAPVYMGFLHKFEISEYDIDFEYAMETLERGEKVMPTDIIIKELAESSLEKGEPAVLPGTGVTATTGIDEEFAPYKESIIKEREETAKIKEDEVKQKLLESKGVQEEKMFEQAKPKKSSGGGSGAKIL